MLLLLGLFAAFILFLDQKIVKRTTDDVIQTDTTNEASQETKIEPKIDFYKVLKDRELDITISEEDQQAIDNPKLNSEAVSTIILQVGSFKSAAEADRLKAELTLLGLEPKVASASVNSQTWHRVQVGPFTGNSGLSRAKNLLLENNVKYMQRSAQ